MKTAALLALSLLCAACGQGGAGAPGGWGEEPGEELTLPVRVVAPSRSEVEDYVETQTHLDVDSRADVHAEVAGRIVARVRDLGDRVGGSDAGLVLARIDDRDLELALQEARIRVSEQEGHIRELELELQSAERQLEQSQVTLRETEAMLARTTNGIEDGTISMEEHERATFARNLARAKELGSQAALDKAKVALSLGKVDVEAARVSLRRAEVARDKTVVTSPLAGIVTHCGVRVGERVRVGDLLYRVEDLGSLVLHADIPVRQAHRIRAGNAVRVSSTATPGDTTGEVVLVAPTVDRESGTVSVKIEVETAEGFRPGLFVTVRIVVDRREDALVVPKRAVLHDDEEGAYLFVVRDGRAARVLVETGFERERLIEILSGIDGEAEVVVEGQDTLTPDAKVEIQRE